MMNGVLRKVGIQAGVQHYGLAASICASQGSENRTRVRIEPDNTGHPRAVLKSIRAVDASRETCSQRMRELGAALGNRYHRASRSQLSMEVECKRMREAHDPVRFGKMGGGCAHWIQATESIQYDVLWWRGMVD
ncbi:hypothetical protein B0H13DRAFT_2277034 [Mycena leptocephala]|nr:hypothetical protein B0H13DRAFT_2277034 [Mycena leptocephala]